MKAKRTYMNIPAQLLSDEIKMAADGSNVIPVKVHFEMPGAPKETTFEVDRDTYVSSSFKKNEKIRIISAFKTADGEPNLRPAIIAGEDFEDIFGGDVELLRTFRGCSHPMQEMIIARHNGIHYDGTEEKRVRLNTPVKAREYYMLTKSTFTPEQQSFIEDWLEHYRQGENAKKLEIILGISPVFKGGDVECSVEGVSRELDRRFSGMEAQKEEIIRHLAAVRRSGSKGTVICLVGPAGTGKTALIRKLGELLHKPFTFLPCSGFTNALDILGDRQVYGSANVGKLVEAFYKVGTTDCLIQLDEFDKMPGIRTASMSKDGNPYNAFLQVFSEKEVTDTFMGVEIPCENTMFICTCNSLDNIPSFIQNRFDAIIHIPAYTDVQLLDIAMKHLIPKMEKKYNVPAGRIAFSERAVREILKYIDDFGARRTEHHIESIFKQIVASWGSMTPEAVTRVTVAMVKTMLNKVVNMKDPRVRFRQHMKEYSPEVRDKVIAIEEQLDRPNERIEEQQMLQKQLEYYINLRPDNTPLAFDVAAFYEKVDKTLYGMEHEKHLLAALFHELEVKKGVGNKRIILMGAPGVGKSALIQAVAEATGLAYIRISLNGISNPGDIIGYGKCFKGADAGIVVREVAKAGTLRVLIHLDELDKVANPETQATLISLLDDSGLFADNFLEGVPIDFRSAVFVATANDYNFSPALYSRFTVVNVGAYSRDEQNVILSNYLIPKACEGYEKSIVVAADAEQALMCYANAGGVRELKEKTVRVVRESVFKKRDSSEIYIHANDVYQILGPTPMARGNRPTDCNLPGLSNGLAVTGTGAGMCFAIESRVLPGSDIEITGLPSEVIIDSVKLAMDVLAADYNMDFSGKKVHIHFAEGAVKKDGPSAGTSILMSLYSAMRNEAIPKSACYTGEIDLFGYVWAVGGIVEKVGAADQLDLDTAYIPMQSYEKLTEAEHNKLSAMRINVIPVAHVHEIIDEVYSTDYGKAIA